MKDGRRMESLRTFHISDIREPTHFIEKAIEMHTGRR